MPLTEAELKSKLWKAADILRGQIDSSDYKNYIFSMLFLKRLSDRFEEERENAVRDGQPRAVAETDPDEHEFFMPEDCRWRSLARTSMGLGEALNAASAKIERPGNVVSCGANCAPTAWRPRCAATSGTASLASAPATRTCRA